MTPVTAIFIGRSGCGKGTQAALLDGFLKEREPKVHIVHLETGALFREFLKGSSFSQKLSADVYKSGMLQPEFLTVHVWADFFVARMKEGVHTIIDGTPRKLFEAYILDSAMKFYKREKPHVILLDVSRKWSEEKLIERHRLDDTAKDIESRLDWFDREVVPAIDYYEKSPDYRFHRINGEQSVDKVRSDILAVLEIPYGHQD